MANSKEYLHLHLEQSLCDSSVYLPFVSSSVCYFVHIKVRYLIPVFITTARHCRFRCLNLFNCLIQQVLLYFKYVLIPAFQFYL